MLGNRTSSIPQTGVLEQTQHYHFTHALGGLLPASIRARSLQDVLDINCRTGFWTIDLALAYPGIQVLGIDDDVKMVEYARQTSLAGKIAHASFVHTSLHQPLPCKDSSMDFVHFQSAYTATLRMQEWKPFLDECHRVMRQRAAINLVSFSLGPGSSEAYNRFRLLMKNLQGMQGLQKTERFGTYTSGVYYCRLLREAGFSDYTYTLAPVDLGGLNNPMGRACCQLLMLELEGARELFVEHMLVSRREFDDLLARLREDVASVAFFASGVILSALAWKL